MKRGWTPLPSSSAPTPEPDRPAGFESWPRPVLFRTAPLGVGGARVGFRPQRSGVKYLAAVPSCQVPQSSSDCPSIRSVKETGSGLSGSAFGCLQESSGGTGRFLSALLPLGEHSDVQLFVSVSQRNKTLRLLQKSINMQWNPLNEAAAQHFQTFVNIIVLDKQRETVLLWCSL